ncbi:MAG: CDP-alcohol phosphatidyltransferase family protein [Candidatus Magasanikbacteria bacterium]|nr:CDP-alcohol phosphatidyltransferase family protein [Candidatus Magasanikbacteria bacterium]
MGFIKRFKERNADLFEYLRTDEIHPHDHFINRIFLRFLPHTITPNKITFFRILTTPLVFFTILFGQYNLGVVLFIIIASTDVLDGSLARTKNKITRFGMLLDPLADKFLIGSMVLLLVFRYLNAMLGLLVLLLEITFIVTAYIARIKFHKVVMANGWGKFKMFLQVFATCIILMALVFEIPVFFNIATGILGLSVGFALMSLYKHGI